MTSHVWQSFISDPLPLPSSSSTIPRRALAKAAETSKDHLKEALDFLRDLKESGVKQVHALWADEHGKEDWFQAKIEKIILTHKPDSSKSAGALVSWLDDEGNVDKSSPKYFIAVYDLKRRLKLPEAEGEERKDSSGMTPPNPI
jgi:hypothetical protein